MLDNPCLIFNEIYLIILVLPLMILKEKIEIFMKVLNLHVPMKKKLVRGNNAPFMNKRLSKAFMERSKLKYRYNKNSIEINNLLYKKQRNISVNLLKKENKKYYNNLDLKIFNNSKKFWGRIKTLFSDKQNVLQRNIIF